MHKQIQQSGFTLVEMVVVISIFAIIGGLSSAIIGRSLDAYAALDRREKIQTSVRIVIERISRELRHALPYSTCVYNDDSSLCTSSPDDKVYFIPVKSSGRYQHRGGGARQRLRAGGGNSDDFHVLSTSADPKFQIDANVGDWIVVFNLNNQDVYDINGPNNVQNVRHEIGNVTLDTYSIGGTTYNSNLITYVPPDRGFSNPSPTRRFSIIDNNNQVTLFYKSGSNLYRDTTTFADPSTPTGDPVIPSANPRLLMENVAECKFTYIPSTQLQASLLRIDLTVEIQGERVQVIHEARVYNVP